MKTKVGAKIYYIPANDLIYPDGDFIIGFAGQLDIGLELADFMRYPETYTRAPRVPRGSLTALILTDKGKLFQFTNPGKWIEIRDKYFAIGSGALAAMGAFHAGASAKEAVIAASKVDPFTGMGTKVMTFK